MAFTFETANEFAFPNRQDWLLIFYFAFLIPVLPYFQGVGSARPSQLKFPPFL